MSYKYILNIYILLLSLLLFIIIINNFQLVSHFHLVLIDVIQSQQYFHDTKITLTSYDVLVISAHTKCDTAVHHNNQKNIWRLMYSSKS